MRLTLSVLRCPPNWPANQKVVEGGDFSIGRGQDNDWVLPPDPYLSSRHCVLAFRAGEWRVADLSRNGTFVNGESAPLGPDMPRALRGGDRLRFGEFEVEVRISADHAFSDREPAMAGPFGGNPFALDPFAARPPPPQAPVQLPQAPGILLPANFNPLDPDPEEPGFHQPTQPNHSSFMNDAFRPPPVVPALPANWADEPQAPPASPRHAQQPTALQPAPAPAAVVPEAARPPTVQNADDAALLAAFLRGAGMEDAAVGDPEAAMLQIGAVMRALVSGIRRTLIARRAVKSEFRIEQTQISPSGNNPLKFAAGDDDALSALIGGARRTEMSPSHAVSEALRDIRLHELASMHAMQAAVRAMIARLDPATLKREADAGLTLPMQRKARAWDNYVALHASVSRSLADDFDSVFGKNFARAYERAQTELAAKEGEN